MALPAAQTDTSIIYNTNGIAVPQIIPQKYLHRLNARDALITAVKPLR